MALLQYDNNLHNHANQAYCCYCSVKWPAALLLSLTFLKSVFVDPGWNASPRGLHFSEVRYM